MLYLFNSGFYERHKINLMDTLFLPAGARNRYRYRRKHVPADVWENKHRLCGQPCTVVFLDRMHSGSYEFVPIRRGRVFRATTASDLLVVDVALDDFVYPRDLAGFQQAFAGVSTVPMPAPAIPGQPENNDGFYVVSGGDLSELLERGADAWADAVDDLAARSVFADKEVESVFVRADLSKDDMRILPRVASGPDGRWGEGVGVFRMNPGGLYGLTLTYRHPGHSSGSMAHPLSVLATENVNWADDPSLLISAPSDVVDLRFSPDGEVRRGGVSLGLASNDAKLRVPTARIYGTVGWSVWFWVLAVFVLLVYAFADVLAAPHITLAVVGASVMKTLALGVMFLLFNKKVV